MPLNDRTNSIWTIMSDDDEDDNYPMEEPFHFGDAYLYDYQWYHTKFPQEWALDHRPGTGPGYCGNCDDYGSINGIFIGYCANCAQYDYMGSRGRGFMGDGVEFEDNTDYPSAFDTYLKGVDVTTIQHIEHEMNNNIDNDENNEISVPAQNNIIEYNEDDYLNADPYEETNLGEDVSIMDCHFEGGYNDF